MKKTRVLMLSGGFGGLYAALEFEKRRDPDIEVTLVTEENSFLFPPILHEVAASELDLTHIVNPIRKMLRTSDFLRQKFSRSIFWNDESSSLTVSTSIPIRSNMTGLKGLAFSSECPRSLGAQPEFAFFGSVSARLS